jgi:hypothetical protein
MPASAIERLPVELLQPIFAAADYNLALTQASNLLGARLSDEYIYNSICDAYFFESSVSRSSSSIGTSPTLRERAAAQTFFFSRRWMTWSFLQRWILRTYGSKGCLCGKTPENGCFDAQWPPDFNDATTMVFSRSHLPHLAFVRGRLPPKLLHGPWTLDRIRFLRFLLWLTGMTVEWGDEEVRRTALQGRRDAMLEGNLEAVELFNHVRRLGRAPTLDTLRFAVLDAGCDRSIVYDTLLAAYTGGLRGEAWECRVLDDWCEERIAEQDSKGKWLREKLELLRSGVDISLLKKGQGDDSAADLIVHDLKWNKVS